MEARNTLKGKKWEAFVFPVLDVLLNGGNLLLHLFLGFSLTVSDYGRLSALLGWLSLLMIVGIGTQILSAKHTASEDANQEEVRSTIAFIMTMVLVASVVASPLITTLLRVNYLEYGIILVTLYFQINVSYYRGRLQGEKTFMKLSKNFYLEMLAKLMLTLIFVYVYTSVFSVVAALMISLIIANWFSKNQLLPLRFRYNKGISEALKYMVTQFFFYYLTAMTMVLVNYYLENLSGVYAISSRLSQIFIFIALSISTVLLPYLAKIPQDEKVKFIRKISFIMTGVFLVLWMGFTLVVLNILPFIIPPDLKEAIQIMVYHGIAYSLLGMSFLLGSLLMVVENKKYLGVMFVGSIGISLIMWLFIPQMQSLQSIIQLEMVCYGSLFVGLIMVNREGRQ